MQIKNSILGFELQFSDSPLAGSARQKIQNFDAMSRNKERKKLASVYTNALLRIGLINENICFAIDRLKNNYRL
jgi:hypothetical protein